MTEQSDNKPFDLVLELLRALRGDVTAIRQTLAEHSQQLIGIRQQIHAVEGHALRLEESLVRVDLRVERLETRAGLIDA